MTFKAEFQAGASGRSFGWIKLNGESLAAAVAAAGWARVKDQGASSKSSELDELVSVRVGAFRVLFGPSSHAWCEFVEKRFVRLLFFE